jgi:lipoate-protein ligase A
MATETWCAAALQWRRMALHRTERAKRTEPYEAPRRPADWCAWIDRTPRPGWANMAIDQALLDRAEQRDERCLRLYSWDPHCLSFGRHEPAAMRYDRERIRRMGIDTVRRPTGGRAVWHSREVTYAVAAPIQDFGSLQDAYLAIHLVLLAALLELGVSGSLAQPNGAIALDAGGCFRQPAGGEVMVGGRKLIGSAQLRRGSALLQHGSILLRDDQQLIARLAKGDSDHASPVPPLFSNEVSPESLIQAIVTTAQAAWSGDWRQVSHSQEVLDSAGPYDKQFRSPAWTWER